MNLNSEFNLLQDQSQFELISKLNQTLIISSIIQRCRNTIFIEDKVTAILNQNWHQREIESTNKYKSDNYFQIEISSVINNQAFNIFFHYIIIQSCLLSQKYI